MADAGEDRDYRLALEEVEELGLQLDLYRERSADPEYAWTAYVGWPNQIQARRLWMLGDPDHLYEPPPASLHQGHGATPSQAAWRAIRKACDEG